MMQLSKKLSVIIGKQPEQLQLVAGGCSLLVGVKGYEDWFTYDTFQKKRINAYKCTK